LKRRKFTWSNKQNTPLLEQLDWFFTSANWISDYPNTMVFSSGPLWFKSCPCVVSIDTSIPKAKLFRFENYWVQMPSFLDCVKDSWSKPSNKQYSSAVMADKLKSLRYDLK
jgi:hypothetical protein